MKTPTISFLSAVLFVLLLSLPATAASKAKTSPMRKAWPSETLSGKITAVAADRKVVVVTAPDGIPFDMLVTPKTRIRSGTQAINFKDLTEYQSKNVSIKFVPERRGDIAKSIRIGG